MSILGAGAAILAPILAKSGAGILADAVRGKSPAAATVIERVGDALLVPAGTPQERAEAIADRYADEPEATATVIREVEAENPEMWRTIAAADQVRAETFRAEHEAGLFAWAWRPGWMYLLGALWTWAAIGTALSLPVIDFATLLALTGIYTGLYMGGHTAKRVFGGGGG